VTEFFSHRGIEKRVYNWLHLGNSIFSREVRGLLIESWGKPPKKPLEKVMPAAPNLTTRELARLLDVSPRRIQHLSRAGIVTRAKDVDGTPLMGRYVLLDSVRGYITYLREMKQHHLL
jgi:hypothetical protein